VPAVPVTTIDAGAAPIVLADPAALTRSAADIAGRVEAASLAARSAGALSKAMSKIGKPYVYGATGPNAFDCSGLVGWAYKQVGVSLPRTSAAQSRVGTPVSKANLRPGDLVFFYKPVSHVAIYIGNGKVVHASTSGQPVKISELDRMPFNSARRV
jgi:cell wall-associated NlpC family hydrolase